MNAFAIAKVTLTGVAVVGVLWALAMLWEVIDRWFDGE